MFISNNLILETLHIFLLQFKNVQIFIVNERNVALVGNFASSKFMRIKYVV